MRKIKFRGKRVSSDEWIYGSLCNDSDGTFISSSGCYGWIEVYPDSAGQFTGLTDKNGNEIYEGDVIINISSREKGFSEDGKKIYRIVKYGMYYNGDSVLDHCIGFYAIHPDGECETSIHYILNSLNGIVIGNIYDNPELLTS